MQLFDGWTGSYGNLEVSLPPYYDTELAAFQPLAMIFYPFYTI
jgi:hypothetical protein